VLPRSVAPVIVVASAVVPKKICAPCTKAVPVAVSVNALEPAAVDEDEIDESVGTGFGFPTVTGSDVGLEPPPGGGLKMPI